MKEKMKSKKFHYLITTGTYSKDELKQHINDSFSANEITLNMEQTIYVKASEYQSNPSAFEDAFTQFSTHMSEVIAMLYSIKHGGNISNRLITVYYISKGMKDYSELTVTLGGFRIQDNSTFRLRPSNDELQIIIGRLQNDIVSKALGKIERELAVFVDHHLAENISAATSPVEKFLTYWSSFNALYTSFADKHIKPILSLMTKDTTVSISSDFGDRDEIFLVEQYLGIEAIEEIYNLRNDIIHGNIFLPMIYSTNENYPDTMTHISNSTTTLKNCIDNSYMLCFEQKPRMSLLLEITKNWINKKIAAMKGKNEEEKNEMLLQISTRYQTLINDDTNA